MTQTQGDQQPQMLEDVTTPEWLKELFRLKVAVREYYKDFRATEAKAGQVWAVALPVDLIDPIMEEPIMPCVFLQGFVKASEIETDSDAWYGYLCLPKEPITTRPATEGCEPWVSYEKLKASNRLEEPPVALEASYILPIYPVYIKPEWLRNCVADFGAEAPKACWEQVIKWMAGQGPALSEVRSNRIDGHPLLAVTQHIKACWSAE